MDLKEDYTALSFQYCLHTVNCTVQEHQVHPSYTAAYPLLTCCVEDKMAEKAKKAKLTEEEKRDPNRRLKPNPAIKVPPKDPFLYSK